MISDTHCADAALRLLVDSEASWPLAHPVGWDRLERLARQSGVLVRLAERFAALGVCAPARFRAAAEWEQRRVAAALALVRHVGDACSAAGIDEFVFAKAFRHYPDIGNDVDLLTLAPAGAINPVLSRALGVAPHRGITEWIASCSSFRVPAAQTALDVYHGRLGCLGEHHDYVEAVVRSRVPIVVGGAAFHTAAPDDQLVLQGLQRVYGRRSFRLADVVYTVRTIRAGVDWDGVFRAARATGTLYGLSCFFTYVDRIYRRACGAALLDAAVVRGLATGNWGEAVFRRGRYVFPPVQIGGGLYLEFIGSALRRRRWRAAARVTTLLPVAAFGIAARAAKSQAAVHWARAVAAARPVRVSGRRATA